MAARGLLLADASVLIALSRIDRLDLLVELPVEVAATEAVWTEVAGDEAGEFRRGRPELVAAKRAGRPGVVPDGDFTRFPGLDRGEASTIAAAGAAGAGIAIDERRARLTISRDPELSRLIRPVVGTLALVLAGRERGTVPSVRAVLDDLSAAGFRMTESLYRSALVAAGEVTDA